MQWVFVFRQTPARRLRPCRKANRSVSPKLPKAAFLGGGCLTSSRARLPRAQHAQRKPPPILKWLDRRGDFQHPAFLFDLVRRDGRCGGDEISRLIGLLYEPVKLMCAGDRIGHDVQSADDGRCGRIGLPDRGRSKIGCKFQTESGKIRRPGQNRIGARRRYGQLRQTGKTRVRVEAV